MTPPRIKVLCVDDSTRLIDAWARLFQRQNDLEMVASLNSADDLVETARELQPDVVLMDLTMDGKDPLEALRELARASPEIRVLVCTGHSDPDVIERVIDAGAWGFIPKVQEPSRIMDAIRSVAGGQMVLPPHG
jgi:DNA-binding NarL/FixJ family response regulator